MQPDCAYCHSKDDVEDLIRQRDALKKACEQVIAFAYRIRMKGSSEQEFAIDAKVRDNVLAALAAVEEEEKP